MRLVDAIEQSSIVVYIRHRVFTETTLNGRIGLVRSDVPTRFLILALAAGRPAVDQLVALGRARFRFGFDTRYSEPV